MVFPAIVDRVHTGAAVVGQLHQKRKSQFFQHLQMGNVGMPGAGVDIAIGKQIDHGLIKTFH